MSPTIATSTEALSAPTKPSARAWLRPDVVQLAIPLALFAALLCATAWPMFQWWYWEYTKPESYYAYAFFVPPLIGVMLWHRRQALADVPKKPCSAALALVIPALALLVIAVRGELQAILSVAFLLSFLGGVWFVFGTAFVRMARFPLFFLWLMAPMPGPVLNDLTLNAQSVSTVGATRLLGLLGLHPRQIGNVIHLENFTMHVDVACSGFKLLLTLVTFSAAFAFLTDTTPLRRWALFLLSLPLAIVVNTIRIALFGIVGEAFGESAAHAFHDWSGLISLILCMGALFFVAKALGCRTFAGQRIF